MKLLTPIGLLLLFLPGCNHRGEATACNLQAEAAVVVNLSGPSSGATVLLIEGAYQETMAEIAPGRFAGGFERAGTYRVEASAPGFVSTAVDGVVAAQLACGPDTQTLNITLQSVLLPALLLVPDADGGYRPVRGTLQAAAPAAGSTR